MIGKEFFSDTLALGHSNTDHASLCFIFLQNLWDLWVQFVETLSIIILYYFQTTTGFCRNFFPTAILSLCEAILFNYVAVISKVYILSLTSFI